MDAASPSLAPASPQDRSLAAQSVAPTIVVAIALSALSVWCYWPTLLEITGAWTSNPDYTHGFFVIPIAIALLWIRRDQLPHGTLQVDARGCWLIAAAGVVRFVSGRFYLPELDAWSVPIWIAGVVWLLGGWKLFRFAWPAVAFLWFATPLPGTLEMALSTPLQKIAAQSSAYALRVLGQPALAEGTTILLDEHVLDVERACSGLRMFYGIFALAVACVIANRPPRWKAALLVLAAPPIAVVANVARISATGLLIKYSTSEAAHKFSHDLAGLVMIPLATCLFVALLHALKHLSRWPTESRRLLARRLLVHGLAWSSVCLGLVIWGNRQQSFALSTLRATSDRYTTQQKWPLAVEYLGRYVRAVPDDQDAFAEYAELYRDHAVHISDRRRAQGLLTKAWKLQPDRVTLAISAIELAIGNQEYRSAVALSDVILAQQPTDENLSKVVKLRADSLLAYLQAGNTRTEYTWDDARGALQSAVELPDADIRHVESLAEVYRQQPPKLKAGEADKLADRLIDTAVDAAGQNPLPWLARYRYRMRYGKSAGDRRAAESDLERSVLLAESADQAAYAPVFVAAATEAMRRGDSKRAAKLLQRAIRLTPSNQQGYVLLAEIYRTEGEPTSRTKAIGLLESGLKSVNRYEISLALPLASLLAETGKLDASESHVEQLEQFLPYLKGAERGTLLVGIGLVRSQLLQSRNGLKAAASYLSELTQDTDVRLAEERSPELLAPTRVVLAEMYVRLSRPDLAVEAYQQALAAKPGILDWRLRLAQLAQQIGDVELAEVSLRSVVGKQPPSAALWSTAVGIEFARQVQRPPVERNWSRTRQLLKSAERLGVPPSGVRLLEVDMLIADGKLDAANKQLLGLAQSLPEVPSVWRALAIVSAQRRDYKAALQAAERYISESQESLGSAVLHAELLADSGQAQEAVKLLEARAEETDAEEFPSVALAIARLMNRMGQHEDATAYLEAAHAKSPLNALIVDNLAEKAWLAQNWTALEKQEHRLQQIEGDSGTLWKVYRAERLLHQTPTVDSQEFREVVAHADSLLKQRPRWPRAHFLQGEIALRMSRIDAATAAFERSWRYGGRNIVVAERLIDLLTRQGKFAEVQQYVSKFRDLLPQSEELFDRAAPALAQGADSAELLAIAEAWVKRRPKDAEARLRLARVLFLRGQSSAATRSDDLQRAEKQLRAAVDLAPADFRTWVASVIFYARTDGTPARAIDTVKEFAGQQRVDEVQRDFVVAQLYDALSMPVEAHRYFQRVSHHVAANPDASNNGEQLARMAQFYQPRVPLLAERYAAEALQFNPDEPRALGVMLSLLVARNDKSSAQAGLQLLESRGISNGLLDQSTEHRLRATLLAQRAEPSDTEAAIELLQGSIERSRGDVLLLASLYERVGRIVPAFELLQPIANAPDAGPIELTAFLKLLRGSSAAKGNAQAAQFASSARSVYERLGTIPGQLAERCRWQLRDMRLRNRNEPPAPDVIVSTVNTVFDDVLRTTTTELSPLQQFQQLQFMLLQEGYDEAVELITRNPPKGISPIDAAVCLCHAYVAVPPGASGLAPRLATIDRLASNFSSEVAVVQAAGDSLFMCGEYQRSVAYYRRVLELQADHPFVRNNLALALGEVEQLPEAAAVLAAVLQERPNDPGLLDTQATLALIGQDPERARGILVTAIEERPADPVLRLHLAVAYEALRDADRARQHLLTALTAGIERQVLSPRDRDSLQQLQAAHSLRTVATNNSNVLKKSIEVTRN